LLGLAIETGSDDIVVFEADRAEVPNDLVLASGEADKTVNRAQVSLGEALEKLKPALRKIVDLLKEMSPDETSVELGLKIGGESGLIIAKGTAEVNFIVRLSWKSQ
jgi:hypothetical protein